MQKIFNKILSTKTKYNSNIVFDTRTLKKNDIFIGIKTKNNDGSSYYSDAINKGSKLIIINNTKVSGEKIIQIKNIQKFILNFCKFLLDAYKGKVIAITGSVGKTTVKENIYHVLNNNNYVVYKSYKNFNNKLGLQFSIMNLKLNTDFSIFELGINSPNEMKYLTQILKPHYCLITGIENSHIGNFKNFNNLVNNKLQIFNSQNFKSGLVNYRHDKPNIFKKINQNIRLVNLDSLKREVNKDKIYNIEFNFNRKKHSINSDMSGINEETAIITYLFLRIFIKKFISNKFFYKKSIIQSRGNIINKFYKGNCIRIFDHSYNSSPYSLKKQLYFFNKKRYSKKLCIIGSMKELGLNSMDYHLDILDNFSSFHFDKVIFIGYEFYKIKDKYKKFKFYKSYKEYIKVMSKDFINFKNVFIMGSRSNQLERIIEII